MAISEGVERTLRGPSRTTSASAARADQGYSEVQRGARQKNKKDSRERNSNSECGAEFPGDHAGSQQEQRAVSQSMRRVREAEALTRRPAARAVSAVVTAASFGNKFIR